jgi:hypothetical protein
VPHAHEKESSSLGLTQNIFDLFVFTDNWKYDSLKLPVDPPIISYARCKNP